MNAYNAKIGFLLVTFLGINNAFAAKIRLYDITNCNGATTPVYLNPTVHSEKIASIPVDAKGIKSSSNKKKYGVRYWQKVTWNSKVGWVFASRLKPAP